MKLCPACKTEPRAFTRTGNLLGYCRECLKAANRERMAKYRSANPEKVKAAVRAAHAKWYAKPENKAAMAKRRSTPEGKAANRESTAKYRATPEGKAAHAAACARRQAKWRATPEGKAYFRAAQAKRYATPEGKSDAIRRARLARSLKRQLVLSWAGDVAGEYECAMALTEASGETYVVDHQVPLQSIFVSGLHVSANLCAIPEWLNALKKNVVWPDMADVSQLDERTVVRLTQAYEARRQCVSAKQSVKACRTYLATLDTIFGELNEQTY